MPKYDDKNISNEEEKREAKIAPALTTAEQADAIEKLVKYIMSRSSGEAADPGKLDDLKKKLNEKLTALKPLSVAFPECSDVMLSLINPTIAKEEAEKNNTSIDDITKFFNDYFTFGRHCVIKDEVPLGELIDKDLLGCTGSAKCREENPPGNVLRNTFSARFPPVWCLPPTCVEIDGARHLYPVNFISGSSNIKRLFVGDLVWLFYFDRMGIFKILGAILDDYAIKGNMPISNSDDLMAIVLEAMTRKTKMGISSTVRDRNITYRRALGWIQEEGRKLNLETTVNTAFTNLFHKFIQTSLEYYKDKRLATAIQASTNVNRVSVATLTSIKDTIDLLIRAFDPFKYGRLYSNTLSGIVWVIAGMAVIRELRTTLGIPSEYKDPDEFIPAAYDLLIAKRAITPSETNRYDVHRDCAENARDILLDLEVLAYEDIGPDSDLELWLDLIEGKIEGYRTAYRSLTGVDLGEPGTPRIEQQV